MKIQKTLPIILIPKKSCTITKFITFEIMKSIYEKSERAKIHVGSSGPTLGAKYCNVHGLNFLI